MNHRYLHVYISIIASEIDNLEKAYELYSRTARLDLDNYNNDTDDGLHITSMSGAWLAIVQRIAGMRTYKESLSFAPKLPRQWEGYSFNINYRYNKLRISVSKDIISIENLVGNPIQVKVYDKDYIVSNKIEI